MEPPKLIDLNSKLEIPINSDEFLIGRGMRNSFIIEDLQVSRLHCMIDRGESSWRIIDKSVNGTLINDKPLPKNHPVVLGHGDVIGVSESSKFLFSNKAPDKDEKLGAITETDIVNLTDALIAEVDAVEAKSDSKGTVTVEDVNIQQTSECAVGEVIVQTSDCAVAGVTVGGGDKKEGVARTDKCLEDAENELQCSICTEMFIRAMTLNCSHTFCNYCISEWRKKQAVCPICRAKITTAFPTLVVDNFIEKMLENASEDVKLKRQEAVAQREALDPKGPAKKTSPAPIEVSSDEEFSDDLTDSEESDWEYEYDNDVFEVFEGYNGIPGAYYGGYGHCFNCGDRGHWANGCPNR